MALPLFAITLFVSAFLLFLVQPMIGKMILPPLGGTPQVWNTCMVFFQMALLAGYAYTHTISSRLKLRQQLIFHGALLLVPLFVLLPWGPFNVIGWTPPRGDNPIPSALLLLASVVGLPFFVVATSAPLLQRWFSFTGHPSASDPYFLYGASNLGSMLALLAYPVVVEPLFGLLPVDVHTGATHWLSQPWIWTFGYILLIGLVMGCASMVWAAPPAVQLPGSGGDTAARHPDPAPPTPAPSPAPQPATAVTASPPGPQRSTSFRKGSKRRGHAARTLTMPAAAAATAAAPAHTHAAVDTRRLDEMTVWRRVRWVLLAACPVSLMLGVTTFMCTDVSAVTYFWVVPLALYLLSFILVFMRWPIQWTGQPHTLMVVAQPFLILALGMLLLRGGSSAFSQITTTAAICVLAFFLTALVCHGELAKDRPGTKHLTEFYLWMSVGGTLGGIFNALLAPVLFYGLAEFPIAVILACFLRPTRTWSLVPLDKGVAIVIGAVGGLVLGALLNLGLVGMLLGIILGAVLGALYEPSQQSEGWTEQGLTRIFPGLAEWADTKWQELRTGKAQPAAETAEAARPRPVVRRPAVHNVTLLSYGLDVILPVLVGLVAAYLIWTGKSPEGWNLLGPTSQNPLFKFCTRTLGLAPETAVGLSHNLAYAIMFGIPLLFCFAFAPRPIRFGLAFALVIFANYTYDASAQDEKVLVRDRSYFGILRVLRQEGEQLGPTEASVLHANYTDEKDKKATASTPTPYTYLMHGTTHHGLNYQEPPGLRRLATTYYHRKGPVGVIMERFNWFSNNAYDAQGKRIEDPETKESTYAPQNTYWADSRMPASLVGLMATPLGNLTPLPVEPIVGLWSEPPYATIGLGTGTMASYARPFQHMTYYEIDHHIKAFSLPPQGVEISPDGWEVPPKDWEPRFNYVYDARFKRRAGVEVVMGDARLAMKQEVDQHTGYPPQRDGYYHAMVVDAFSSDAIPVHLITKESIELYFSKLAPAGVLMVHTSNRHVDLVKPVTDVAKSLGLAWRVGKDNGAERSSSGEGRGHFASEYVMLARDEKYLPSPTPEEKIRTTSLVWYTPQAPGNRVWTDDYSNLLGVFRWGLGH